MTISIVMCKKFGGKYEKKLEQHGACCLCPFTENRKRTELRHRKSRKIEFSEQTLENRCKQRAIN